LTGHDAYTPTEDTPFPPPVGDILILGVAASDDTP
jgi:hypothetical protein